jgi:predicted phosphodiesterase
MKIIVCGDVHGNWYDLKVVLDQAVRKYNVDACIQVGDFGFYPNTFDRYRNMKFCVPIYVIDGNHENHEWLKRSISKGESNTWKDAHNIFFISRGSTMVFDNIKMGFMGGAMNVDSKQYGSSKKRTTNYPLNVEIKEAINAFNSFGKLDFLFTHSCPHSIGVGMHGSLRFVEDIEKYIEIPFGVSTGKIEDCGEHSLLNLWNGLVEKPTNVLFGHFHQLKQTMVGNTTFTCVGTTDSGFEDRKYVIPFIIDTCANTLESFPASPLCNASGFHSTRLLEKNDYPI